MSKPPVIELLTIDQIKPYGRNPRENGAAIAKVKQSIQQYGYNQLIAVDQQHVIIVGHTRYCALKELGWKEIAVQVLDLPPAKAKAYRIVDNKTQEYAKWKMADLGAELRELGDDLPSLQSFFLEDLGALLDASVGSTQSAVAPKDVAAAATRLNSRFDEAPQSPEREVECPHCHEKFNVRTR
jgi:hypothetical protein